VQAVSYCRDPFPLLSEGRTSACARKLAPPKFNANIFCGLCGRILKSIPRGDFDSDADMKIDRVSRLLPFSCEQVFDVAADVERYPEFLPGWISARILKRESNRLYVEQVLGIGPARLRFDSRTVLYRPERIEVTSSQPPFRYYSLTWLFVPGPAASCSLSVLGDLELQSNLLQHVARRLLPASIAGAIAAFEARANSLYVRRGG
jgi:coenzyme Q-binding protein COQ10